MAADLLLPEAMAGTLLLDELYVLHDDDDHGEASRVTTLAAAAVEIARQMMAEPEVEPSGDDAAADAVDRLLAETDAPMEPAVDALIADVLDNAETLRVTAAQRDVIVAAVDARARIAAATPSAPAPAPVATLPPYVPVAREMPTPRRLALLIAVDVLALASFVGPALWFLFD